MSVQWFYSKDGQQLGPVTAEELKRLAAGGQLQPGDFIWREGLPDWQPASRVKGLFQDAAAAAPFQPQPGGIEAPQPEYAYGPEGDPYQRDRYFAGYAGFWKRFAAAIIDGFVLIVPGFIVGFILGFVAGSAGMPLEQIEMMGNFVGILINWLYHAVMESSSTQATLGKMALGIKVTDMDGNRIGFGRASGRFFGMIVSTVILFIGFIMAGLTEKKQALHDIMAGCLVVNK